MKCETCGGERRYEAISNKPDPGYQLTDHSPDECIRVLRSERAALTQSCKTGDEVISRLTNELQDERGYRAELEEILGPQFLAYLQSGMKTVPK